ncbi:hypothetical protein NDI54_19625 [Haloarcula sp. S1AR25-5A]|uniref:Uncharacterized protein n=1 Tax=Haloarcula terrestris TaxID=2950533 RepID=A0AAE4F077_9EURY|nr:hypothetical protein [Haloarcula terrestris]MDS0223555.1 hypothetical protein [Haloarcula terrestris]
MLQLTRRQLLGAVCAGTVVVAGCSSDQTSSSDGTENSGSGAETTPETTSTTATGTSTNGGTHGQSPQFGQAARFPDSYAMTMTMESDGRTMEMSGRVYQGDMYWSFDQQGQQMEMYHIGNSTYTVAGGQCFRGTMQQGMDRDEVDPGDFSDRAQANPELTPAGRDTIDGEDVLVYELSQDEGRDPVTYYILADSGYPRRIEAESMQWDFHSWGSVEPIQQPDGNCQSMPGSGMTADGGT